MGSSERVPEQKDASWINIFGLNVVSSDLTLMSLETHWQIPGTPSSELHSIDFTH